MVYLLLHGHFCTLNISSQRWWKTFESGGGQMIAVCVSTQQLGGTGGCSPRNFFEIRCSEVTSEALLGQKLPLEKNFLQFTI